jgi:PhzF family phenazine biosynthesis protein
MKFKVYQVDAFTDKLFSGNPAVICKLDKWLKPTVMQNIASESSLAATAFYVKKGKGFEIKWFSPTKELHLCGHATLAAAHVLFYHEGYMGKEIYFNSQSGLLQVRKESKFLTLNFPADKIERVKTPAEISIALNIRPIECFKGKMDYMLVFSKEADIVNLKPNFYAMSRLEARGVICTAKGNKSDFVSRFFAPTHGINEDPVTGSAHTTMVPYWANILGKKEFKAIQLSERKGHLKCAYLGNRVEISGEAKTYLKGEIEIK